MAEITRESNRVGSLLSSTSRVEAPFIRVNIGGYSFGVYEDKQIGVGKNKMYKNISAKFPNYVQSLNVKKINGAVNKYTISMIYPITPETDPNFFERLFSTVARTRTIKIDYGDFMLPNYIYREEEAIITNVTSNVNIESASIDYSIEATSTSSLALSGCYSFGGKYAKPSDEIISVLYNANYHLLDVFTGMKDISVVKREGWLAGDDKAVQIPTCPNISALEYISILVSYMSPLGSSGTDALKTNVYALATFDDVANNYGGPYFKVQKIQRATSVLNKLCVWDIDIGYPTANIVTSFRLNNNSNWSIIYDYNASLNESEYIKRINNKGELEYEFSPMLVGAKYDLNEADKTWWTKVTGFPVTATLRIKGLLKPAILMQYVKLNVWFYGNKHISSGYYLITGQEDSIDGSGYFTTLSLLRTANDEGIIGQQEQWMPSGVNSSEYKIANEPALKWDKTTADVVRETNAYIEQHPEMSSQVHLNDTVKQPQREIDYMTHDFHLR